MRRLPKSFYNRPSPEVARDLIGKVIAHRTPEGLLTARITETEAYLAQHDEASHSHRGMTRRNRSMFADAGTCYVFIAYGMYPCLNVVTGPAGHGEAVLIRAAIPSSHLEAFARRRKRRDSPARLCNGPGKLAQGLGITIADDGTSFVSDTLWIGDDGNGDGWARSMRATPRIGISKSKDLPLRFVAHPTE